MGLAWCLELARGRFPSIHRVAEKAHSRKLVVAIPATNIPFYSAQSSVTPYFCCLLAGYRHTCCKDLLRGAIGCCSRVARELVLCNDLRTARPIGYTGLSSQGGRVCPLSRLWPFVGRYTSCLAPYPLADGRDGHEGPPTRRR